MRSIDDLILEVDQAIENGDISNAAAILNDILAEDPKCAQAHNHLGWIYRNKYSDIEKAEMHYKLAIQFNPNYGSPYINYIFLLRDQGRIEELEEMLNKASKVNQVNKSVLNDEYGTLYELKQDYNKAIEFYKKAIAYTLNNNMDELKGHINRCVEKQQLFSPNRFVKALRVLVGKD